MSKIKVIYLLPELKGASGGAKVIYNHSLILNKINNEINSRVVHLKKKIIYKLQLSLAKRAKFFDKNLVGWNPKKMKVSRDFVPDKNWFSKKIETSKDLNFDSKKDFVIIPEIWAHFAEDLNLKKRKVRYSIFVQGSYHMNSHENFEKIRLSYEKADFILTTSEYSLNFIKSLFPKCKNKILKINLSTKYQIIKKFNKINLITTISRKLPSHIQLLLFYLKNKLPANWKLEILENIDNDQLKRKLLKSKIFLSFSHFEGFGLPPLEAALAGNKIIGYDGGGGQEYWKGPIFTKVNYGEIYEFGEKIIKSINEYNLSWIKKTQRQRLILIKKYSLESEKKSLNTLCNKIIKLYQ
jgi:hypothetical protein